MKPSHIVLICFVFCLAQLRAAGDASSADLTHEVAEVALAENDHWSFQPIRWPRVPEVENSAWSRNPIDSFVLARLEEENLSPSSPASRVTWIRRLSLDLLGLVPSQQKVDRFLQDERPDAYERLVDRLLASPRYGERWARHWLDLARYADSDGFTIDAARSIWKYRDWVIDALNRDLSFDQFGTAQLAGDLLPEATVDQLIATGFHRNTLINQEGGTSDEQFRVEAVVDRVNTTAAVFIGLTIGCAQCHDHKYDPITQRDFYRMFAVFNHCEDNNDANKSAPILEVPSPAQSAERQGLQAEIVAAEKPLQARDAEVHKGLPQWEKKITDQTAGAWTRLDPIEWHTAKGSLLNKLENQSLLLEFSVPANDTFTVIGETPIQEITAVRIEALTDSSLPEDGPGRGLNGNFVLSELELLVSPREDSQDGATQPKRTRLSQAVADHSQDGYPIANAIDGRPDTGWAIGGVAKGSLNVNREAIFFPAERMFRDGGWRMTLKMHHDHFDANHLLGCFRISVGSSPPELLEIPSSIRAIASLPRAKRSEAQQAQLEAAYLLTDEVRRPLAENVSRLKKRLEMLTRSIPTTMILKERKERRPTHIHVRGDFLRKGAQVSAGVPLVLPQLPQQIEAPTRLDFARWLFDRSNPLTARVTVNRFWQRFFGIGLVETENDFGTQGISPDHPELLDWIARELIRRRWGIKSIHRLLVNSAAYRQSSAMRPELLGRDQRNKLLARQSRIRLEAEAIRDVGLAASGLLSGTIGGPGVYPPQPEGIYILTQQKKAWPEEQGEDRYRRGMYTYFWRSSPYPFLPTFDAPDTTTTCTRRSRSNTPLQSLTLANDRVFFEMAQGLAERILWEGPANDTGRIRYAFQVCLSREPSQTELTRLMKFYEEQRSSFQAATKQAEQAAPAGRPQGTDIAQAAAWTAVARVLLNLDEFITRE